MMNPFHCPGMVTAMFRNLSRFSVWGPMALMAATRFHHFGDFKTLPDASLAAFFLAGLFAGHPGWFGILLLEAGLIDYLAITYGGVSGWCVTPAYLFLVPTYGAMWLGGRWCRRYRLDETSGLIVSLATLAGTTLLAFLISNASFYLLSGYFDSLSPLEYATRVARHLLPYLGTTLAYAVLVLGGLWLGRQGAIPLPLRR